MTGTYLTAAHVTSDLFNLNGRMPVSLGWNNSGLELEFTPITVAVLVVIRVPLARPGARLSGRWYDIVKREIASMTLPLSAQSWPH